MASNRTRNRDRAGRRRREVVLWLAVAIVFLTMIGIWTVRVALQRQLDSKLMDVARDGTPAATAYIEPLLKMGADPNARQSSGGLFDGGTGDTALMNAAAVGNVPAMKVLLAHGAAVNAITWTRETALMRAAAAGRPDAVTLLLERGASPAAQSRYRMSALDYTPTGYIGHPPSHDEARVIAILKAAQGKR